MTKAMAKKGTTDLATVPDYLKEELASNEGNENIGRDDLLIPRLIQTQALSPQLTPTKPEYIEGLKPGQLFNSITKEPYPDPTPICLYAFEKTWVLYQRRSAGGGFFGAYRSESDAVEELKQQGNPNDFEVQETAIHWGFARNSADKWDAVAIHMYSTKLTTSKNLNSLIKMRGGARWAHLYALTSKPDTIKGKGDFFRLMAQNLEGWPEEELVLMCKEYHKMVLDQIIKSDFSDQKEDTVTSDEF